MRTLFASIGLALLTACAGPRYHSVNPAGDGGYYLAQSPPSVVYYDAAYYYSPFQAYGIYPWWGYTYYSPNFYPHYFSMWYPNWSGNYGWYGGPPYACAPYRDHHPAFPPLPPDDSGPAIQLPVASGNGAALPVVRSRTRPAADIRSLYRDTAERGRQQLQPGAAYPAGRYQALTPPSMGLRSFNAPPASLDSPISGPAPAAMPAFPVPGESAHPGPRAADRSALWREP
jgi:hypothetical protein